MDYNEFLNRKKNLNGNFGFKALSIPDFLFDFQKSLIEWALIKGKCAIFADTGLGKTAMQLVIADNIVKKTNKNVLLLTPLAVANQTLREAEKFGIGDISKSRDGSIKSKIVITNYQQLSKFNSQDFESIICDESSCLKDFNGQTKTDVTRFANKMPYRFLFTATPSPNDFVELGTSSEILGNLKYMDMISQFFRDTQNDKNPQWSTPQYVLKGHAIHDFWRWVSSWARAIKKPSDLGFNDDKYLLPALLENEIILECSQPLDGELFVFKAKTLKEQRAERQKTTNQRCDKVIELCEQHESSVVWAHYNYETDLLKQILKDSVEISGSDSDESKEEKFEAFTTGQVKRLITKPKIGAWGLNWQHCNHMTFFPSHSYEQYYQGVRRCWRFGQTKPVIVDIITTEGEQGVCQNIKRKANDAEIMFKLLVKYMNDELELEEKREIKNKLKSPSWL